MQALHPGETALYRHYDADDVLLYIGIAVDADTREMQHRGRSWWALFSTRVEVQFVATRADAERAEIRAIWQEKPIFNTHHNAGPEARQRCADYLAVHAPLPEESASLRRRRQKLMAHKWDDVRQRAALDEARIAAHKERLGMNIRAARLADVRKRVGLTQQQTAISMGTSQARVSAIENGEFTKTELGTIMNYIAAIGGTLQIVADFGDEKLVLG